MSVFCLDKNFYLCNRFEKMISKRTFEKLFSPIKIQVFQPLKPELPAQLSWPKLS